LIWRCSTRGEAVGADNRREAAYPEHYCVTGRGLISHGPDTVDPFRRAAAYVNRILRGEKPGDLPIQAPTKYELVINRNRACRPRYIRYGYM